MCLLCSFVQMPVIHVSCPNNTINMNMTCPNMNMTNNGTGTCTCADVFPEAPEDSIVQCGTNCIVSSDI